MRERINYPLVITVSSLMLVMAILFSVASGPMNITVNQSLLALLNVISEPFQSLYPKASTLGELPSHVQVVVEKIRLPRTLLAIAVGGLLAMCGAVMQGLFRNPLADPGIIGVSAGASLGAALAIVLFGTLAASYPILLLFGTVPVFAFLGGAVTTLLVYRLGSDRNGTSVSMMLLAGVAISALAGAVMGLLNYYADDQSLRDLSLWTMGSLAGADWQGLGLAYGALVVLGIAFYRHADALNAMLLGEAEARHMGINIQVLKRRLILLTAAGVGVTVSLAGMIGFVGLLVPHLCRLLTGPSLKTLIPISAIVGALLLLLADILSRTLVAPQEIPVGIVTALLGAPFFIWQLLQQKGRLS